MSGINVLFCHLLVTIGFTVAGVAKDWEAGEEADLQLENLDRWDRNYSTYVVKLL
jgi:hypothetical protein